MTARDEAIEIIRRRRWDNPDDGDIPGHVLDAIPGDVLVRLAIERGALVQAEQYDDDGNLHPMTNPMFYRVVES